MAPCPIQVTTWSSGLTLGLSLLFLCVNIGIWLCNSCVVDFIYLLTNFDAKAATAYNLQHVTVVGVFMELMSVIFSIVALVGVAKMNASMVFVRWVFLHFYMAYELAVLVMFSIALNNCWKELQAYSDKVDHMFGSLSNLAETYLRQYIPVVIFWALQFFIHIFCLIETRRGHRMIKMFGRLAREKYVSPISADLSVSPPPYPGTSEEKVTL